MLEASFTGDWRVETTMKSISHDSIVKEINKISVAFAVQQSV
jgi:hypothetical protein